MSTNNQQSPFTTRPIENPNLFFGRADEISEVVKRIKHSQPLSTILIGGRKIGKTSFLNQTIHLLSKKTTESYTCIPTLIDLQSETITSPAQFFERLTNLVQEKLKVNYGVNTDLLMNEKTNPYELFCNNLLAILDRCARDIGVIRLVFLIDEADRLLGKSFTEDLFIQLRHLINSSELSSYVSLVITGFRELHDYAIMEEKGMGSVLGGDSRWTYLGVLNEDECRQLITETLGQSLDTSLVQSVYQQSGGHPYITQYIMDKIWCTDMSCVTMHDIANTCNQFEKESKIFSIWQSKSKELDSDIYELLANKTGYNTIESLRERVKIKVSLGEIRDSLDFLLYTGIVKSHENMYQAAGDLYRQWFLARNQNYFDKIVPIETDEKPLEPTNFRRIQLVSIFVAVLLFSTVFLTTRNLGTAIFSIFLLWLLSTLAFWTKDIKLRDSTNDASRIVQINDVIVQSIFDPVIRPYEDHKIIIQASQRFNNPIEVVVTLQPLSQNLSVKGEHIDLKKKNLKIAL